MEQLTGDDPKVVLLKFSTIGWAVFVIRVIAWHRQAWTHLELKTRPAFCPVISSILSMEKLVGDSLELY